MYLVWFIIIEIQIGAENCLMVGCALFGIWLKFSLQVISRYSPLKILEMHAIGLVLSWYMTCQSSILKSPSVYNVYLLYPCKVSFAVWIL